MVTNVKPVKVVFYHDIDENGRTSNFEYVIIDSEEDINSSEGKSKVLFSDGTEKEVEKKNLLEITPGSIMAAISSGSKIVELRDFKNSSEKFFREKGLNVFFSII